VQQSWKRLIYDSYPAVAVAVCLYASLKGQL